MLCGMAGMNYGGATMCKLDILPRLLLEMSSMLLGVFAKET